jgi:hypothetical protein
MAVATFILRQHLDVGHQQVCHWVRLGRCCYAEIHTGGGDDNGTSYYYCTRRGKKNLFNVFKFLF